MHVSIDVVVVLIYIPFYIFVSQIFGTDSLQAPLSLRPRIIYTIIQTLPTSLSYFESC